jgi:polysaccharide export outer membrane protein
MSRIFVLLLGCWAAAAQVRIQPTPDATVANLPAQRIGANDLIAVSVYDAPELTRTVRVGADGLIRLPMLRRRIQAQGLLPGDLEVAIAEALQAEQLIVEPVVTVTVVEYHSRPISVAGAVKNPVTFQAVGPVTLLDAVTRAGGLSQEAGPEILVSRAQPGEGGTPTFLIQRIPIKGLIDQADPALNLRLTGGEEIRVPEAGKVFVVGNVKKPGAYPIREGAETSVLRVLAVAEGLTSYSAKQAFIYRREEGSTVRHEITIEIKKIMQRQAPDVPLQPNDIFYIPDNSGRRAGLTALERIAGFGAATTSGILIYRR